MADWTELNMAKKLEGRSSQNQTYTVGIGQIYNPDASYAQGLPQDESDADSYAAYGNKVTPTAGSRTLTSKQKKAVSQISVENRKAARQKMRTRNSQSG